MKGGSILYSHSDIVRPYRSLVVRNFLSKSTISFVSEGLTGIVLKATYQSDDPNYFYQLSRTPFVNKRDVSLKDFILKEMIIKICFLNYGSDNKFDWREDKQSMKIDDFLEEARTQQELAIKTNTQLYGITPFVTFVETFDLSEGIEFIDFLTKDDVSLQSALDLSDIKKFCEINNGLAIKLGVIFMESLPSSHSLKGSTNPQTIAHARLLFLKAIANGFYHLDYSLNNLIVSDTEKYNEILRVQIIDWGRLMPASTSDKYWAEQILTRFQQYTRFAASVEIGGGNVQKKIVELFNYAIIQTKKLLSLPDDTWRAVYDSSYKWLMDDLTYEAINDMAQLHFKINNLRPILINHSQMSFGHLMPGYARANYVYGFGFDEEVFRILALDLRVINQAYYSNAAPLKKILTLPYYSEPAIIEESLTEIKEDNKKPTNIINWLKYLYDTNRIVDCEITNELLSMKSPYPLVDVSSGYPLYHKRIHYAGNDVRAFLKENDFMLVRFWKNGVTVSYNLGLITLAGNPQPDGKILIRLIGLPSSLPTWSKGEHNFAKERVGFSKKHNAWFINGELQPMRIPNFLTSDQIYYLKATKDKNDEKSLAWQRSWSSFVGSRFVERSKLHEKTQAELNTMLDSILKAGDIGDLTLIYPYVNLPIHINKGLLITHLHFFRFCMNNNVFDLIHFDYDEFMKFAKHFLSLGITLYEAQLLFSNLSKPYKLIALKELIDEYNLVGVEALALDKDTDVQKGFIPERDRNFSSNVNIVDYLFYQSYIKQEILKYIFKNPNFKNNNPDYLHHVLVSNQPFIIKDLLNHPSTNLKELLSSRNRNRFGYLIDLQSDITGLRMTDTRSITGNAGDKYALINFTGRIKFAGNIKSQIPKYVLIFSEESILEDDYFSGYGIYKHDYIKSNTSILQKLKKYGLYDKSTYKFPLYMNLFKLFDSALYNQLLTPDEIALGNELLEKVRKAEEDEFVESTVKAKPLRNEIHTRIRNTVRQNRINYERRQSTNTNSRWFWQKRGENHAALIQAITEGADFYVNYLLKKGIDPTTNESEALRLAASIGNAKIVYLFLNWRDYASGKKVDPTAKNYEALCEAVKKKHTDVVALLLNDPRIDPSKAPCEMLGISSGNIKGLLEENSRVKRGGARFTRRLKTRKSF